MENRTKTLLIYLILPLFLFTVAVFVALHQSRPDLNLQVHDYTIGKTEAAYIQTYEGAQVLIDGGNNDEILKDLGSDMAFYDRSLDLVVVTKPDAAHVGGLVQVLKRYRVKSVLLPVSDANVSAYWDLLDLVKENKIQKIFAQAGQKIWLDSSTVLEISSGVDQIRGQISFDKTHITIPVAKN